MSIESLVGGGGVMKIFYTSTQAVLGGLYEMMDHWRPVWNDGPLEACLQDVPEQKEGEAMSGQSNDWGSFVQKLTECQSFK